MSTNLHYGQIIRLHCAFQAKDKAEMTGLITSKSYTDPTLFCQTYRNFKAIPNYRESLFQILPMSSFDINDQLNNAPQSKRESLQPRAKTEREQFESLIKQKRGESIYFGAQVVFKHYDSGYYITGCFECARSGIGAFKIYLSPTLSSEIIFKLQSFRTYEKDGDEISLRAPIKIYHELTHCYLSFETEDIFLDSRFPSQRRRDQPGYYEPQPGAHPSKSDRLLSIRPTVKVPSGVRYQLINQNIPKRAWRFQQHQSYTTDKPKQLITNHDLVYFLHTKDNKYLVPHINSLTVYLKKIKEGEALGDFFDGVWEIQEEFLEPEGSRNMSLARKHRPPPVEGEKKKRLVIRHLTSGRILICYRAEGQPVVVTKADGESLHNQIILTYESKNLEDNALVNFQHTSNSPLYPNTAYMDARPDSQKQRKSIQRKSASSNNLARSQSIIQLQKQDPKLKALYAAYENFFEKCDLIMSQTMNQHGFRIYKLTLDYKQQLMVVLSSQQLLNKFTNFLTEPDEYIQKVLNFTLLNDVTNTLKYLIGFIYNCPYDKIKVLGNNPVAQRQKLFGELGMVELATALVYAIDCKDPMLSSKLAVSRKSEYNRIRNIYELGYEILESVAKNNRVSKLKISFFLDDYLKQIIKPQNKVVYKSLQVVLEDNYMAIEKIVTQDLIKELIMSFNKVEPDPEDLKFMSILCICQGRSVKQNQNTVQKEFYKVGVRQHDLPDSDKFKFREDHNVMQIGSTIPGTENPRYRTLPGLYIDCQEQMEDAEQARKDKGHWRYFIQYLNLLADLCMHRNTQAQKYVDRILPLDKLVAFLQEHIVQEKGLYQPFIRLVHYAYIQNYNYDEISRISKAKYWNQNQHFDIPRAKNPISPSLNKILDLIMNYIKKINHSSGPDSQAAIVLDPSNLQQLRNVYTFLQLLKSTLNLGFWQSMSKLKEMVPCMLRIMKFDAEYASKELDKATENKSDEDKVIKESAFKKKIYDRTKNKLTLNKPEINLLVKCKILAAEILDIIIDNQTNIRVSEITKLFKDILQMNLDLSEFNITEQSQMELDRRLRQYKQYPKFKPDNEKERNMLNEKIWIAKLTQMMQARNIFSEVDYNELNPVLVLFEISRYRNQILANYSLSLLNRIYGQRRQILLNFSNMIIVSKGNLLQLSKRAEQTRSMLLTLASYNILNVVLKPSGTNQTLMWDTSSSSERITSVIQELAYLTIKMKKKCKDSPNKLYKYESLYPYRPEDEGEPEQERTFTIINEKEQPNTLHQLLIKSQDHHLILYEFIKIMEELPDNKLPCKVLHAAYNFLTVLVWNNQENKDDLSYFLKKAVVHLKQDIGALDFFREMYRNNKKLVQAESDLSQLVDLVVNTANKLDIKKYYKSKLMDFLRVLVIFDDKGYQKNQNIVMEVISRYQVSAENKTVFISNPKYYSINDSQFENYIGIYAANQKDSCITLKNLNLGPELSYIANFFQIFSALIQNQNAINIGKCTNMHPYEWLVKLLRLSNNCWPVIRHLRAYINKLYYAKSREIETQQYQIFIQRQFLIIRDELKQIAKLRENYPHYGLIKLQNPIRYTYLGSYIFLSLQQILISLHSMFDSLQFIAYFNVKLGQGKQLKTYHSALIQIAEILGYLMRKLDGRQINKFMSVVRDLIRGMIVISFPLEVLIQYDDENKKKMQQLARENHDFGSDDIPFKKRYVFYEDKSFWRHLIDWYSFDKQEKQRTKVISEIQLRQERERRASPAQDTDQQKEKEYRVDNICLGKIERKLWESTQKKAKLPEEKAGKAEEETRNLESVMPKNLVTSKSKHFKLKNQPQLDPEKQNILVNARRKKLLKFMAVNKDFQDFKMEQFYDFSQQLALLDTYSNDRYGLVVVGAEDVIRSFVDMHENNPGFLRSDLRLTLLNLLTNFITRHNEQNYKTKSVDQWEGSDWLKYKPQIKQAQDFLNSCNCAQLICTFIKYHLENSLEMANRLFLFGVAFLLGGNRSCQDSFMEIFKNDDKNIIFEQIERLIKRSSERITLSAGSKQKVSLVKDKDNHPDTYDFYDDRQNIMYRRFGYEQDTSEQQKLFNQLINALSRVYRFMQLLCESNNSQMKNFIRTQVANDGRVKINSIDYIEITNVELRRLFKILDASLVHLPLSLIHFLNEVTQLPCIDNQGTLCKGTFFEDICLVSKATTRILSEYEKQTLLRIYNKSIDIAHSCLQGNLDRIFMDLSTKLQNDFLINVIQQNLEMIGEYKKGLPEFERYLEESKTHEGRVRQILKIMSVVSKIEAWMDKRGLKNSFEKSLEDDMKPVIDLLRKNLLCIEIKNETAQLVYFPYHPVYRYLSDSTKDKIMFEINRQTSRDKLIGLIKTAREISNQIDYNYTLDHLLTWPITISISSKRIDQCRRVAQLVSVIICILMVSWAQVFYYPEDGLVEYNLGSKQKVINVLRVTQFFFTFLYISMWLTNRIHLSICKYEEEKAEMEASGEGEQGSFIGQFLLRFKILKIIYCLYSYENQFASLIMFSVASVLGTFFKIEFYSLHLFDLVAQIDILTNVFQAVTQNLALLGIVSLLGLSFIFIFSVFGFSSYLTSIYPQDVPKQHCQTVMSCIMTLYISEEIGNDMDKFNGSRFVFDLMYTVFMDLIFSNIISGIMIDTFASLRDHRKAIQNDKKGLCFICGQTRQTLQKSSIELEQHYIDQHHVLWHYVFYLYYLHQKFTNNDTFTGLEYIIQEKIANEDVSWIPSEADDQKDIASKLEELHQQVNNCTQIVEAIPVPTIEDAH